MSLGWETLGTQNNLTIALLQE